MTEAPEATEVSAPPQPARQRHQALAGHLRSWVSREHVPFAVVLIVGAVLRWITWRAYRPALLFPDSHSYLQYARHLRVGFWQPSGYPIFLWPLVRLEHPTVIPLVQHLLGLAIAVLIYLVLRRRGVPSWGAALAAAPILLDPLQLIVEQYVLSDVLFEFLVCAAIVLLVWHRRPGWLALGGAGLLLGAASVTRSAGIFLVAVAVVGALTARVGWRVVALVGTFCLSLGAYVVVHHATVGTYAVTDTGSRFLYARLAHSVVDCPHLRLPDYERALCPAEPLGQRASVEGGKRILSLDSRGPSAVCALCELLFKYL